MTARLEPLGPDEWGDDEYAAFGALLGLPGERVPSAGSGEPHDPMNFPVVGTLAHHPGLTKVFLRFNNYQLFRGAIPARLRELAILRTAQTRRSPFEWGEHVRMALDEGITEDEIERLGRGNDGFEGDDLLTLEAVDELLDAGRLADTWDRLVAAIGTQPAIELIFLVGTYQTLAMAFETWGLTPAEGPVPLPPPHQPTPEGNRS